MILVAQKLAVEGTETRGRLVRDFGLFGDGFPPSWVARVRCSRFRRWAVDPQSLPRFPAAPVWPTGGILARLLRLCCLKHCRVVGYIYWVSSQTLGYWSRTRVIWRKWSRGDNNHVYNDQFETLSVRWQERANPSRRLAMLGSKSDRPSPGAFAVYPSSTLSLEAVLPIATRSGCSGRFEPDSAHEAPAPLCQTATGTH